MKSTIVLLVQIAKKFNTFSTRLDIKSLQTYLFSSIKGGTKAQLSISMFKTTGIPIKGHIVKTIFPVQSRHCVSLRGELREIQEYRPDPRFPNVMLHVVNIDNDYYSITHGEPFPCDEKADNEELTSYAVDQIAHSIFGLQEFLKSISQSKTGESTLHIRLCDILQEILEVSVSSVHTGHEYCKYGFKVPVTTSNDPSSSKNESEKVESSNEKDLTSNLSTSNLLESYKTDSKENSIDVMLLPLPGPPKAFDQPKTVKHKVLKSKIQISGVPISGHIEAFMFVVGGKKCVSVKASLHEVQLYFPAPSQPSISLEVIDILGEYYSVSHGIPIDLYSPLDVDDFLSGCVFHVGRQFCLLHQELAILQDHPQFSVLSDKIQELFESIVAGLHNLHSRFIGCERVASSPPLPISEKQEATTHDTKLSLLERMEALEIEMNETRNYAKLSLLKRMEALEIEMKETRNYDAKLSLLKRMEALEIKMKETHNLVLSQRQQEVGTSIRSSSLDRGQSTDTAKKNKKTGSLHSYISSIQ